MKREIGTFTWENGSVNDGIISVLNDWGIDWRRTASGEIFAQPFECKVSAEGAGIGREYTVFMNF